MPAPLSIFFERVEGEVAEFVAPSDHACWVDQRLFVNKGESLMARFHNDPVISVSNSTGRPAIEGEDSGNQGVLVHQP